jgi:hypothetical protein
LSDKFDGNFRSVEFTPKGKLRVVCDTVAMKKLAMKVKQLDGKNIIVEEPFYRPRLNYCWVYGIATDMSIDELKEEIVPQPDFVTRLKKGGQDSTTLKLGFVDKIPDRVNMAS